jgi:TonB family protein
MTTHHSILKANLFEPKLRWMILLSFIVHLILFSIFIGKEPKKTKKVYFSPTYSVNLVNMPTSPASGKKGSFRTKKTSLWKGPAATTSRVKTMSTRKHTILTIPKRSKTGVKSKTNGSTEKSMPSPWREGSTLSGSEGQQAAPAGTAGNAGQTGPVSSSNIRFNRYYTAVYNKIYNSWVLPGYGSKRQLEAVVNIRIAKNGKILSTSFEQRSGSAYFDRSVLRAIKKANPLPPLPVGFNEKYLELGIRFIPEG